MFSRKLKRRAANSPRDSDVVWRGNGLRRDATAELGLDSLRYLIDSMTGEVCRDERPRCNSASCMAFERNLFIVGEEVLVDPRHKVAAKASQ
jgi:hypothetical protein